MSYDLCSSRQCNVCLLLLSQENDGQRSIQQLSHCSGCGLVVYCSAEHQKLDWSLHRDFCAAIQKIKATCNVRNVYHMSSARSRAPSTKAEFERKIVEIKCIVRFILERPLHSQEEEFTSFPRCCVVCYSFNNLRSCGRCQAVSYCSRDHEISDAASHNRICGQLRLCYCPYKLQDVPQELVKLQKCVPNMQDIKLPQFFELVTGASLPGDPTRSLTDYQMFATASDFSCITTICYALSHLAQPKSKLAIFIVGASVEQELWFRDIHVQLLFLQFPQITSLELYFIGPEVPGQNMREQYFNIENKHHLVLYQYYEGLLQNFLSEYGIQADLLVAFNCGFSEHGNRTSNGKNSKDTWRAGLAAICKMPNLPVIFTSFTSSEAKTDYDKFLRIATKNKVNLERFFDIQTNPYRDLRPLRNWQTSDKEEIYFRNGYIQGVFIK